jgi:hypothetical protein
MTTKPSSEFLFFVGNHSKSHVNLFFSPQKFQFFLLVMAICSIYKNRKKIGEKTEGFNVAILGRG